MVSTRAIFTNGNKSHLHLHKEQVHLWGGGRAVPKHIYSRWESGLGFLTAGIGMIEGDQQCKVLHNIVHSSRQRWRVIYYK